MARAVVAWIFLSLISPLVPAQTGASGNFEVYSRPTCTYSIGYLRTNFLLPIESGGAPIRFNQKGVMYSHTYDIGEIGTININDAAQLRCSTQAVFRIGAAVGSWLNTGPASDTHDEYLGMFDPFAFQVVPELTFVHAHGMSTTIRCGVGVVDVGMVLAMPGGGMFSRDAVGLISLVPLSFEPSVFFDFGRAGLGASFFVNPANLVEYRVAPRGLYGASASGVRIGGATVKRYAMQLLFIL